MTGVDHVIRLGIADEKRLGIMGWSYGGYLTAWTLTQTTRFRAASVGAGVSNLVGFSGTDHTPRLLRGYLGHFWENPELYRARSPILHLNGVKTPTLIQHGAKDRIVPIGQGYELYHALKAHGCMVRMVAFPNMAHSPDHEFEELMAQNLDWFDRYLLSTEND